MKDILVLFAHLIVTFAKLIGPGDAKSIVAENLLLKQQLLVINRSRQRAPNLTTANRFVFGLGALFLLPNRITKVSVIIRPSTLLKFHQYLVRRKYRLLFSPITRSKPGPKGPSEQLIHAIIELKRRNPDFGCPRIAMITSKTFGVNIDKDVVRRVLAKHYHPQPGDGPSWLTFIGHMKDSLWSIDFFRCESINLKSHWVLVVMDQFTRRIIGFAVHPGDIDGMILCRMFNRIIVGTRMPRYLSSDNHPVFEYHRWKTNLSVLGVDEIKTVSYVPVSHPFIERLIGTIRREFLDHVLFWNSTDLVRKLEEFRQYYNDHRCHASLNGNTPTAASGHVSNKRANLQDFRWKTYCRDLVQLPLAT
jgi:transposase InsO family protein